MVVTLQALNARIEAIPAGVRGILLIVLASALFASMHNTIRFVTQQGIHPFEVAFFRTFFGLIVFIPIIAQTGLVVLLRTERFPMHVGRAFLNAASMLSWMSALALMPVADATAVSLIGPVFVAILAMMFLGERVGPIRWLGITFAIAGGLVVVRPGFTEISSGVWLVLLSAVAVSNSKLIAKILTRTESPATIVAYLTILMTPITLIPALFYWQTPTLEQTAYLVVIGILGSLGHLLFVQAYKLADISLVEPAMFMRMVWAAVIGFVLFAEFPDLYTWIGAAVIVVGTTLLARPEAARTVRPVSPAASTVDPPRAD